MTTKAHAHGTTAMIEITGLSAGQLTGRLVGTGQDGGAMPALDILVDGTPAGPVAITPTTDGAPVFSVAVPAEALADGVRLLSIRDRVSGAVLGHYPMVLGPVAETDTERALAVLQAEFAALKQAFLADAAAPKLRAIERDLIVAEALAALEARTPPEDDRKPGGNEDGA